MSEKNYWWATRPKRKLVIVPELLKVFATVATEEKWRGNREKQAEFEEQLVKFQWKAQNTSKSASGARTYAVLLNMLGLWYEDEEGVKLTQAGKEIVSGEPTVPILSKQLIDFQYPSPYASSSKINPEFKIQPYRFIIEILSSDEIGELSTNEVAYCVIPYAKTHSDLDACIEKIKKYRQLTGNNSLEAEMESGTSASNLRNIANTFFNQLEYTGWFKFREKNNAPFEFDENGKQQAQEFITKHGRGLASFDGDVKTFQKRFGSGLNKSKDYSDTNPIKPDIDPSARLVLMKFYELAQTRPIEGISNSLVSEIASSTGVNPSKISDVLGTIGNQALLDRFEENYIILSKGGNDTATEFEKVTTGILDKDGFGFPSEWVGPRGVYPDIFVYLDRENKRHGIVDTKAYRSYNLPIDHRNKMAHDYVPRYQKLTYEGVEYKIAFFAYVAGGYSNNMQNSFDLLIEKTGGVNGSYITAYSFMQLLRKHRRNSINSDEFIELFSSNKEILLTS